MKDDAPFSKLAELLIAKNATLAVAESCTGGLFSDNVTDVPGASSFFKGGIVTYTPEAKRDILGITEEVLNKYGQVSEEITLEMARKAVNILGSDYSVSITGNAGPTADIGDVGDVFICVFSRDGAVAIRKNRFKGNRWEVKQQAVDKAIEMLLELLQQG